MSYLQRYVGKTPSNKSYRVRVVMHSCVKDFPRLLHTFDFPSGTRDHA